MLRKIEWSAALLLTLLAAGLHFVFLRHAGALWRDEAGALNLATMPRIADVWAHLHYDSFPILWVLVARFWSALGLGDDGGLRLLGFLTGVSILGALWFNARIFKISLPLVSLALLGFCPTLIIWGDSMRAWGWGVLWILLTLGFAWRVVEAPVRRNIVAFGLAAFISVQSTYYNSVLLMAICAGGLVVAARRRSKKTALALVGVGMVSAISMLPYLGVLRRGADEYVILRQPFGIDQFLQKLTDAVRVPGAPSVEIWMLVVTVAVAVAILCRFQAQQLKVTLGQRDLLLFSLTTLIVSVAGYFLFLKNLHVVTMPWYYTALLAMGAMTLDVMLSVNGDDPRVRIGRLAFASVVSLIFFSPARDNAQVRLTNVDTVAKTVSQSAVTGDLIMVDPWFFGVSFGRYYSGTAAWTGLPDVKDYQVHRYDTLKKMMTAPEPSNAINDVLGRIEATLKSGKRVWIVGGPVIQWPQGAPLPRLLTAPNGPSGWNWIEYGSIWSVQAGAYVSSHAKSLRKVDAAVSGPINHLEDMQITVAEGWREN